MKIAAAMAAAMLSPTMAITARLANLSTDRSRMGAFYINGNPKRRDGNDEMRHVDSRVRQQTHRTEMGCEVQYDIDAVPDSQSPKINARGFGRDQTRNQGQRAQREVTEIDQRGHAEKAEHLAVRRHNSRNVIQRIHEQKQSGESQCEF